MVGKNLRPQTLKVEHFLRINRKKKLARSTQKDKGPQRTTEIRYGISSPIPSRSLTARP